MYGFKIHLLVGVFVCVCVCDAIMQIGSMCGNLSSCVQETGGVLMLQTIWQLLLDLRTLIPLPPSVSVSFLSGDWITSFKKAAMIANTPATNQQ